MLTIDALSRFGANTKEGMGRCANKDVLYLRLVNMVLDDTRFDRLAAAIESNDKKAAFENAHALKGSLGNLSLTPLYTPIAEMTEMLRNGEDADYAHLLEEILRQRETLLELRNN
ncbi:MAG: Hpt domain-containing protein [Lachnospiraceae bacterium]|nr:Hpt domain-containing protein [Lachnospiraceae bacterium]